MAPAIADTGGISGTVTQEKDSAPAADVCVMATPLEIGLTGRQAMTDASGEYEITGLDPGHYKVKFGCRYEKYIVEYFDDQTDEDSADHVLVESGETTANIDAELAIGAKIIGKVTDIGGGSVSGATACAARRPSNSPANSVRPPASCAPKQERREPASSSAAERRRRCGEARAGGGLTPRAP